MDKLGQGHIRAEYKPIRAYINNAYECMNGILEQIYVETRRLQQRCWGPNNRNN